MKILHVITNLGQGGAEGVLYRLISASPPGLEHVVVSMMKNAYFGSQLRTDGVEVHTLDKPRGRLTIYGVRKLHRLIADTRPDVVQTWMYHSDLVGGLVARWAGVKSVVWGIRNSNLDSFASSFSARAAAKACALLSSRVPAAIVCCSERAALAHQAIGYCADKFTVIPNGYDLSRFAPDAESGMRVRLKWGIQPGQILLGMVARRDAQKNHENLLLALAVLKGKGVMFRCALVGAGMDKGNFELVKKLDQLDLAERMILAGPSDDIPAVMNALDLHVLSSAYGEAFPNVVAEAMACGTPCVVTDVGDAALILGPTGWVVPPKNANALAQGVQLALAALAAKGRDKLGGECRMRIVENFSLENMVAAYVRLWERVQ
jgi:glycosyltransferase involved in cell wall biosynthesis